MGKKNTETLRFAFGVQSAPGSAVWRLNVHKRRGDVYLHNAPQVGADVHISLHASGKFSVKLGKEREAMGPPFRDQFDRYWAMMMFFKKIERPVPPISPSGQIEKVIWLGWPKCGNLFMLSIVYTAKGARLTPSDNEFIVGAPIRATLFNVERSLHVIVQEREITEEEKSSGSMSQFSPLDFRGENPLAVELIRISKTPLGPSAIIYEGFQFR